MKSKKTLIVLISIGILTVIIGSSLLGIFLYKNKLNKDLEQKRVAAKNVDKVTASYLTEVQGIYPDIDLEVTVITFNMHFYEGLTQFDKDLRIKPLLAESWENPNETTWRFRLKKGVKFHNGQELTSEDVKASYDLAIADENLNQFSPGLDSVKIIDKYTVDIITKSPDPILVNTIPPIFILPKSLIESKNYENPIGTGPYKLIKKDKTVYTLERFENYYGEKPKVKNVVLNPIADKDQRFNAVVNGEIDISEVSGSEEREEYQKIAKTKTGQDIKIDTIESTDVSYIGIDLVRDKSPYISGVEGNPFKNIKVREAMLLALNVDKLLSDSNMKDQYPISQLVTENVFGYNPKIQTPKQNVEKAKLLMKEAGYENGFNVMLDISTVKEKLAENIKKQLEPIKINIIINALEPSDEFFQKLLSGDTSMHQLGWGITSGDALEVYEALYGDNSILNKFQYNNPKISDLISKTRSTFDQRKRRDYMQQMAEVIAEDKSMFPLYSNRNNFVYRSGLEFTPRADSLLLIYEVSGAVPDDIKNNYTLVDTIRKIIGIKK